MFLGRQTPTPLKVGKAKVQTVVEFPGRSEMAGAAVSLQGFCEESHCSVCKEYFRDPVTIECGHNFCRACLTRYWEGSEGGEEASCPQCREQVRRQLLIPNRQLANVVELIKNLCLQEETSAEGKRGVCGKHKEPLKFFCLEEAARICLVCYKSKEHRHHQVYTLEAAADEFKHIISMGLEILTTARAAVLESKEETEEGCEELLKQTKAEINKTKELFRKLHSFWSKQEKLVLAPMEELEKEIARKRDEHLATLSEELRFFERKIPKMEQERQLPPSELLQEVERMKPGCEESEEDENCLEVLPELKWRVWDVCDGRKFLAKKMQMFRDTFLSGFQLQKANVTLDPNIVCSSHHRPFILSGDYKSVRSRDKNHPSGRFPHGAFVLGCEGFTAGRHYWEVTVKNEKNWALGISRKSVWRSRNVPINSKKGFWAVGRLGDGSFDTDYSGKSFIPVCAKLSIRVSLNYEEGQVTFHDADTGSQLYSFCGAPFSGETLLPFFHVSGKASLTISA